MARTEDYPPGGDPMTVATYRGGAGVQRCGDWCRHFEPLDATRWEGFGRCVHPLSLRSGAVFSVRRDCTVGEPEQVENAVRG